MSKKLTPLASLTQDFTFALGRLIQRHREAKGLSVAALAKDMGIGTTRIKELEAQNPEAIGAGGFQISTLLMLALAEDKPVDLVCDELIAEAGIKRNDASPIEAALNHKVNKEALKELVDALGAEKPHFRGNLGVWALELAAQILLLTDKQKLDLEMSILRMSPQRSSAAARARQREILEYSLD